MTKQEAIETIKLALSQVEWDYPLDYAVAFDIAISAMEKQDVPDICVGDMISRQNAIDATWFEPSYTDPLNVLTEVRDRLKALPSAQPERKKGEWINRGRIIRCNKCKIGYATVKGMKSALTYNFCPNCGADMRGKIE